MNEAKPFCITKKEVWEAYQRVKEKNGAAGVDDQSIEDFEKRLKKNLYKIWNRMSSGSYFPPPVRTVKIPKKNGGERKLGIPTVGDRIAQQVVKARLEPELEPLFHADSYGYRPGKSALDAGGQARERCWRYDWVVDLDIKGFFDNLDQNLLLRAVKKHAPERWIVLYIERWLKAPVQEEDGRLVAREKGTPQGGVASPLLANLFLHYALDRWLAANRPQVPFERYADDVIAHCRTEKQAQEVRKAIAERLRACGLELHPEKTKIVYCKDDFRKRTYPNEKFDFLGYTFQPRRSRIARGSSSLISVRGSRISQRRPCGTHFEAGNCLSAAIRRSKICHGCSIRLSGVGSNTTGDIIVRHSTRPCATWIEILSYGPSGNTKSCTAITGGQHTGSCASRVALRRCSPTGRWGCGGAP